PLAQWVPRLIGLSQVGSWPTQTPFSTSAVTVQPTEQWVHIFFFFTMLGPVEGIASARLTIAGLSAETAARPPAASPEALRKLRRSIVCSAAPARMPESFPRAETEPAVELFLISMVSLRVSEPVGLVVALHMVGFLVALLLPGLGILRRGFDPGRNDCGGGHGGCGADTGVAQEVATGQFVLLLVRTHGFPPVFGTPLGSEGKSLCFNRHENAPGGAERLVQMRARRLLEIGEEPLRPGRDVLAEHALLGRQFGRAAALVAADQQRHQFAQRAHMVLRLIDAVGAGIAELGHVAAQLGQRPLVEEAGAVE